MTKIARFQDLEVWQEAHRLVLMVYQVSAKLPVEERFGLISQMRRASVSIPANIAEGFKRRGISDKIRHYNIAEGSLEELKYFCVLVADLGYTPTTELMLQSERVGRILSGLIASTENRR